jgi:hypothetical protein
MKGSPQALLLAGHFPPGAQRGATGRNSFFIRSRALEIQVPDSNEVIVAMTESIGWSCCAIQVGPDAAPPASLDRFFYDRNHCGEDRDVVCEPLLIAVVKVPGRPLGFAGSVEVE